MPPCNRTENRAYGGIAPWVQGKMSTPYQTSADLLWALTEAAQWHCCVREVAAEHEEELLFMPVSLGRKPQPTVEVSILTCQENGGREGSRRRLRQESITIGCMQGRLAASAFTTFYTPVQCKPEEVARVAKDPPQSVQNWPETGLNWSELVKLAIRVVRSHIHTLM
ncbi:hypothetical protein GN956_G22475 [Arapaima gigas]